MSNLRKLLTGLVMCCSLWYVPNISIAGVRQENSFEAGSLAPYFKCTTKLPNDVRITKRAGGKTGEHSVQTEWHSKSWDGSRSSKGAEICSDVKIHKSATVDLHLKVPSRDYPYTKTTTIVQLFQHGRCKSWAAMLLISRNSLEIAHRSSCGRPINKTIVDEIPRDRWINVTLYFKVSSRNDGSIVIWVDQAERPEPVYNAAGINFGFGDWTEEDSLTGNNPITLNFGQYNYQTQDYEIDEKRIIYFDDIFISNTY